MRQRSEQPHPIILRWHATAKPLPCRALRGTHTPSPPVFVGQPWAQSGDADRPFDFCASVQRLIVDIAERCPDFHHIQAPRILISVTQARHGYAHGLQARVTPLRFARGELTRIRRGVTYHIQRYFLDDHEFLYVLTFCLPRFLNQSFEQKMVTILHELYHIHPHFDGDLRRHGGRYHMHTRRQCEYNRNMMHFAREYLATGPDRSLSDFLRLDFAQLQARHGVITGIVVPRPKIIPLIGRILRPGISPP